MKLVKQIAIFIGLTAIIGYVLFCLLYFDYSMYKGRDVFSWFKYLYYIVMWLIILSLYKLKLFNRILSIILVALAAFASIIALALVFT